MTSVRLHSIEQIANKLMKLPIASTKPPNLVNKSCEKLIPTIPNIIKNIRKPTADLTNILSPLFFVYIYNTLF